MKSPLMLAMVVGGLIGISPGLASATLMFQDGLDGYFGTHDTELREHDSYKKHDPSTTYGSELSMTIDANGAHRDIDDVHALLRFDSIIGDDPGQIALGSNIGKATLRLYVESGGNDIYMLLMNAGWIEADAKWTDYGANGIDDPTDASMLRELEGRPHTGSLLGHSDEFIEIDVTAELQYWANGGANHGWAFTPTDDDGVDFSTSESITLSHRPKLTVSLVPEPGTLSVFGLGLVGLGYMRRRRAI